MSDVLDLLLLMILIIGPVVAYYAWRLSDNNIKRHQREMRKKRKKRV